MTGVIHKWPWVRRTLAPLGGLLMVIGERVLSGSPVRPWVTALGVLLVALAFNTFFGALLTIGIGNYGPSLVLFNLLGMDPRAAFPIMMGSCAFLMPIGGVRFVNDSKATNVDAAVRSIESFDHGVVAIVGPADAAVGQRPRVSFEGLGDAALERARSTQSQITGTAVTPRIVREFRRNTRIQHVFGLLLFSVVYAFLVLLLVLVIRPKGILGERVAEKV